MSGSSFSAERTPCLGLTLITARVFADDRGFFYEAWREDAFRDLGVPGPFIQDNHSVSRLGVLRGLHWQGAPSPQGKLVRCTSGRVRDAVVDIRAGSPTFGRHDLVDLEGARLLYVPPGYAHGFLALTGEAQVQYRVTAAWDRAAEGCLAFDDPELAIDWGFDGTPLVSARDRAGMSFADYRGSPAFRFQEGA